MISVCIRTIDENDDRWFSLQALPRVGDFLTLFDKSYRVTKVTHHLPGGRIELVLEIQE